MTQYNYVTAGKRLNAVAVRVNRQVVRLPILTERPDWSKAIAIAICPVCGDSKGHCYLFPDGNAFCVKCWQNFPPAYCSIPIALRFDEPEAESPVVSPLALRAVNDEALEVINALDAAVTAQALQELRGYPNDLAAWLTQRGIRFGSVADLRLKVSAQVLAKIKVRDATEPFLWLPVVSFYAFAEPHIVGFQLRRIASNADPKYLTVRFLDKAPSVHIALPTPDRRDGQRWSSLFVAEGILKAEAIAYFLGAPAVAALGTGALRKALSMIVIAARQWHNEANLFTAPITLAPDADAREKEEVAKAWWQTAQILERQGCPVSFAVWSPRWKGIDDALLAGEKPVIVTAAAWLASLDPTVRNELLKTKVRPRLLLDSELAELVDLPESVAPPAKVVTEVYEATERMEVWLTTFAQAHRALERPRAIVVLDASPTGSGKTKAAANLRRRDLRKAGLPVRRIVYIAPEVKRPAVKELEAWRLLVGRDSECVYWERLQILENEGLDRIGHRVCAHCPMRTMCGYRAQKARNAARMRVSWQSYSPRDGDLVILDEFSRLPLWRDFSIDRDRFDALLQRVERFGTGGERLANALRQIRAWLDTGETKQHDQLASLFAGAENALNALADEVLTLISDIRPTREWVYKKRDDPPRGFWWVLAMVDILRGFVVGQVWCEKGTLRIKRLDPKLGTMMRKATGVLILDATADPAELERLLGAPVVAVRSDDPEIFPQVLQVPLGAMTHKARPESKRRWLWLVKQCVTALQAKGYLPPNARYGVLTHKDAADAAQAIFGKETVAGWWGRDERATNAFYEAGVQVLVAAGLPHRNLSAIAAERLKAGTRERTLRKARLDSDGRWWTVKREFADPDLAAAVNRESAVAYLQAAGRLRQNRRSEPCYLVVFDAEPLPPELSPTILPPEAVLPPEVLAEWQRRRQRGFGIINALRQRAMAERIARIAKAVTVYRHAVGKEPDCRWLSQATGLPRRTVWRLTRESWQVTKLCHTFDERMGKEGRKGFDANEWHTLVTDPPPEVTTLDDAIKAFLREGLPVPKRALARRFGVSHVAVIKRERQLALTLHDPPLPVPKPQATVASEATEPQAEPAPTPLCPACGEPLDPEPDGKAACIGCGRAYNTRDGTVNGQAFKPSWLTDGSRGALQWGESKEKRQRPEA